MSDKKWPLFASVRLFDTFYPHFYMWVTENDHFFHLSICLTRFIFCTIYFDRIITRVRLGCALLKSYPPKLSRHLSNNIQSKLSAGGAKQDFENAPKCTRMNCILAPRFHPRPSGDDEIGRADDMMINCYKLIPWSHFFFLSYLWEIERVNWMRTDLILWEMFSAVEYIYQQSGRFPHHLWVESLNKYQNMKAMCQSKSNFLFFFFVLAQCCNTRWKWGWLTVLVF